jgi:hypothetical protein
MILLSSLTKESLIKSLNDLFYSTTYNINDKDEVIWKDGEIKADLSYKVKKGRHQILRVENNKPTTYEKNNLPIEVRRKYCEIIEKYQIIMHYENGIITKEELIKNLSL